MSLLKKPNTTTGIIKVFLVNNERFDSKIVFGFDGAGESFGVLHGPAVAVGAGWESSVRAAEPSLTPHCWSGSGK